MMNRVLAEFSGTFCLVLGGCGSAVLFAAFPDVGIGLMGVSLASGMRVLTMAYAAGPASGLTLIHLISVPVVNPSVNPAGGRLFWKAP